MGSFFINGGVPLRGEVRVDGSKNGALPVLFATLLCRGVSVIENFPAIGDTLAGLKILEYLGARCSLSEGVLTVDTTKAYYRPVPAHLTSPLRASTYLIGGCLGGFGRASLPCSGGCNFSTRPIDLHLDAVRAFGCMSDKDELVGRPRPAVHTVGKHSVGATVNSLLLASSAEGVSLLSGVAREPHVDMLIDLLRSMGAHISACGDTLTVRGGKLHPGKTRIRGDMIEAGSYLAVGAVTGGAVSVSGVSPADISSFTDLLCELGVGVSVGDDSVHVFGRPTKWGRATAAPYPAFPTDLQPILSAVLAVGQGGEITDTVFPHRFGYLDTLARFGLKYQRTEGGARIFPSRLFASECESPDLRGGMSAMLVALGAHGESRVGSAQTVLRGYSDPIKKLSSLGADIKYIG